MEKQSDNIIVFRHFDNAIDANIAKTKLDAYGVPCFLTEENMAGLYPGQSLYAFKVRLHMFAADRDRAVAILSGENFSIESGSLMACPRCQSEHIGRDFPKKLADRFVFVFFGIFFPHRKVNFCRDCGFEF